MTQRSSHSLYLVLTLAVLPFLTDEEGSRMLYGIVFNQRLALRLQTDSILQFQPDTDQLQP